MKNRTCTAGVNVYSGDSIEDEPDSPCCGSSKEHGSCLVSGCGIALGELAPIVGSSLSSTYAEYVSPHEKHECSADQTTRAADSRED